MSDLLAMSMLQPWATLHVRGLKLNETRGSQFRLVGKRIYIQASLRVPAFGQPWEEISFDCNSIANHNLGADRRSSLPRGSIIGRVDYVAMYTAEAMRDECPGGERFLGDYSDGRYAFVARNPVMFKKPIPCRGQQAVPFHVPDSVAAEIYKAESLA